MNSSTQEMAAMTNLRYKTNNDENRQ